MVSPDQPISPATLNQPISLLSLSTLQCATYVVYGCYGHLATADVVKLWNLKRKYTDRQKEESETLDLIIECEMFLKWLQKLIQGRETLSQHVLMRREISKSVSFPSAQIL